jgi:hypothetical protein
MIVADKCSTKISFESKSATPKYDINIYPSAPTCEICQIEKEIEGGEKEEELCFIDRETKYFGPSR